MRLCGVAVLVRTAWTGAFDRAGFNVALLQAQEALRREAGNGAVFQCDEAGVRRWASVSQRAIGAPWVTRAAGTKTLGEIDLIAVTGLDVGLNALDAVPVSVDRKIGGETAVQPEWSAFGGGG